MHISTLDRSRMDEVHSGTVYRQKLFKTNLLPGAHASSQVDRTSPPARRCTSNPTRSIRSATHPIAT